MPRTIVLLDGRNVVIETTHTKSCPHWYAWDVEDSCRCHQPIEARDLQTGRKVNLRKALRARNSTDER